MEKTILFNGKKVHYTTSGTGNALVFLHGFLEDLSLWKNIIIDFERNYHVICIDLPGHGKTDIFGEKHSMSLMADVVAAVLRSEEQKSAIITGHSMGGYAALAFAKRYRDLSKGIVLLNSTSEPDSEDKKADRLRGIKVVRKSLQVFVNEAIPRLFADHHRDKFHEEIEEAKRVAMRTPVEGVVACILGMMEREDNRPFLKNPTLPVFIIAGKYDNVIPEEKSVQQITENEKVRGAILENSGHLSVIEEKEATVFLLHSFFEELS
jgi:pimeloyl-ACP methyl ester carboxylesterase